MEIESMCRTCMRSQTRLLPLFRDDSLCFKIETLTSVQMVRDDRKFPSNICEECVHNINKFYNFRIVVINNDSDFRDRYRTLKVAKNPKKVSRSRLHIATKDCIITNNDFVEVSEVENVIKKDPLGDERCKSTDTELDNFVSLNCELMIKNEDFEIEESNDTIFIEELEETDEEEMEINEDVAPEIDKTEQSSCSSKTTYGFFSKQDRHCKECNLTFDDFEEWEKHKKEAHRKYSICNICGKSITSYNLLHHLKIHTIEPATCKVCGKQYRNMPCLKRHMVYHRTLKQEITCEVCGNSYTCRKKYVTHMRCHKLEKKKSKCTICDKLLLKEGMKDHMRVHTGERPYVCQYCGKGFSSTHARKTHIRQHTNEKPYLCEFCPMRFRVKVSLRTHLRSKHSISDKAKEKN